MAEPQVFESRADTIGAVRGYVQHALLRSGCPDEIIDSAVLCASELATNALLHGDGGIGVSVELGERARVTVHDRSRRLPVLQHPGLDDDGGRGLMLVDHLAEAWGYVPEDPGKAVWFEIDLRRDAPEPDHIGLQRRHSDGVG